MIQHILYNLQRFWSGLLKRGSVLTDIFRVRGDVEARLIYASGPLKGQVAQIIQGQNIVTSWLSAAGAAPTSGRDLLRRILTPASFAGSLAADPNATVSAMQLGSGTYAEQSSDTTLVAPLGGTTKVISDVVFDPMNPHVKFICVWDESEANATITEAALYSGRSPKDFLARKTFTGFSKTSEFTLELHWTFRF